MVTNKGFFIGFVMLIANVSLTYGDCVDDCKQKFTDQRTDWVREAADGSQFCSQKVDIIDRSICRASLRWRSIQCFYEIDLKEDECIDGCNGE